MSTSGAGAGSSAPPNPVRSVRLRLVGVMLRRVWYL